MRIAAVNWKLRAITTEEEFYAHIVELLDQCAGCDMVVLPEMFGLELLGALGPCEDVSIPEVLAPMFDPISHVIDGWLHRQREAGREPVMLVGGSNILHEKSRVIDRYTNSAPVFSGWLVWHQAKVMLTEWEKSIGLTGGEGLYFHQATRSGVTVCYDAEFPRSGRFLAEEGALFQFVPAWTETMHGFRRVRWACQARALENQVCVVHASLVGRVGDEESHGSSAVIVPPQTPFPLDPVLAETAMDEEGVAIAEVEPSDLLACREQGEVRNWRDRAAGNWAITEV